MFNLPFLIGSLALCFGFNFGVTIPTGGLGVVLAIVGFLLGVFGLIGGGAKLVDGAASLARKFNIPTIVIGLTVVSFGTSAPEFFVNVISSIKGESAIVISNIVGSNISNLLLILGVSSIIYFIKVSKSTLYKEIPFSFISILALLVLANDIGFTLGQPGMLSRADGMVLLIGFVFFMIYAYLTAKNGDEDVIPSEEIEQVDIGKAVLYMIVGITGLYIGGELIVNNAVHMADKVFGVPKSLIGLTVVAIGTSLPELVASVIAAFKKQPDMAIGNVIGSNIFNILWILSASSIVNPIPFEKGLNKDIIFMGLATIVTMRFAYTQKKIKRREGIVLTVSYVTYISFTVYSYLVG